MMNISEKVRDFLKNAVRCAIEQERMYNQIINHQPEINTEDFARAIEPTLDDKPTFGRWIPVSERLPEKEGQYLLTIRSWNEKGVQVYSMWVDKEDLELIKEDKTVLAWMPLPAPYKEEMDEETNTD